MRFSQFCDMVEHTEQEQQLLQFLKQDGMEQVEEVFANMTGVPIVGKLFAAINALSDYETIAEFKQSEHYQHLKDWNVTIDFDKKLLLLGPNDEQKKKAVKILAVIGTIITLIMIYRKLRRRRNCNAL